MVAVHDVLHDRQAEPSALFLAAGLRIDAIKPLGQAWHVLLGNPCTEREDGNAEMGPAARGAGGYHDSNVLPALAIFDGIETVVAPGASRSGTQHAITIVDFGAGISEEHVPRLTE